MDFKGLAAEHFVTMFQCGEAVVDIPHVPVQPSMVVMMFGIFVELFEHLLFEFIVVRVDVLDR